MERTYETTLDFGDLGDQPVTIYYDWQPFERGFWRQPEVPEGFDITDVKWKEISVMKMLTKEAIEAMKTK